MKRFAAMLLAVCMLLSGCSTWMQGSYVSVTPYMSPDDNKGQDVQWISDKAQLYDAARYMVSRGIKEDVFFVRDYQESELKTDVLLVRYGIMNTDPIGAYAVEDIQFETGINGGRFTLSVKISYRRQQTEILRMKSLQTMEDIQSAIAEALDNMDTELVFYMENYQDADIAQLVDDYALSRPDRVIEIPRVSVSLYPAAGENRVVELSFAYQTSRDSLRNMQSQVKQIFESAKLYVSEDESDYVKLLRLYVFLTGGVNMDRIAQQSGGSSITPSYSLLRYGVGDSKAFATVYAAMCRQAGVECITVSGTRDGEAWFWNIVKNEDYYAHVDVLRCAQFGYFHQRFDDEMGGYVWDYSEYPACNRPYQPATEPPEETTDVTVEDETSAATEETTLTTDQTEATEPPENP